MPHALIEVRREWSVDEEIAIIDAVHRSLVVAFQIGIPGTHVSITVRDIPTSNWGIRGGQAACDVDLGFDVSV